MLWMSRKVKLKINTYKIISQAVEDGIAYGFNRAYKHTDTPGAEHIKDQIEQAVLNELCDVINFGDAPE
jgi:hypothetical protein